MPQELEGVADVLQALTAAYEVEPTTIVGQAVVEIELPEPAIAVALIHIQINAIHGDAGAESIGEPAVAAGSVEGGREGAAFEEGNDGEFGTGLHDGTKRLDFAGGSRRYNMILAGCCCALCFRGL